MHVHGPFARAKINKVISTFLFYEDVVYRLRLPLDNVQYPLKANAFFLTHLMSEIKKKIFCDCMSILNYTQNNSTPYVIN